MVSYIAKGVFLVIFSVLTALTNLILMTTILCTRQFRLSSKYIIVLALCTCDLISGLFQYIIDAVVSFLDNDYFYRSNRHLMMAVYIYMPYILATLRMSLMIALLIDFWLSLMIRDVKLLFKISLIMIACSIVTGFALVFPMVPIDTKRDQFRCPDISYHALNVSTYFPQMVVLVFLGVTILYVYSKHRTQLPNFDPADPPASPMDIVIAAAIMVWFGFPQMVYLVAPNSTIRNYGRSECGIGALCYCMQFLNLSQTFVIPLVWFANFQIRNHIMGCRCLYRLRNEAIQEFELSHNTNSTHLR